MMGTEKQGEGKLFYYGFSLEKRVPKDHILRRVSEAVDFGFVRRSVGHTYGHNGHESEDPIVIMKLMFLLFFEDVKSERELMRILPMRLDWLWFLNLDLDSEIPHHSVLSKARARWGLEVFEQLFVGVVRQCLEAKLIEGSKIHLDASLVTADASRDSVVREPLRRVYQETEKKLTRIEVKGKRKWVSRTDAEAVVVKKGKGDRPLPRYKNHRAVDDRQGVITAVVTTLSDRSEPHEVESLIEGHERSTGKRVSTVVGDHQYGTNENYRRCVKRGIRCHLGDVHSSMGEKNEKLFSREDFDYEADSDRYRCPAGHYLKRYRTQQLEAEGFADYRMQGKLCQQCALKPRCTSSKHARRLKVPLELELVEMGRAQSLSPPAYQDRRRRKHLMEGSFGDATHCHHFKRARWRGLQKQSIQDLLIAVCQNVRILYRHSLLPLAQERFEAIRQDPQCFRCFPAVCQWFSSLCRLFWAPMNSQPRKMSLIQISY